MITVYSTQHSSLPIQPHTKVSPVAGGVAGGVVVAAAHDTLATVTTENRGGGVSNTLYMYTVYIDMCKGVFSN